QANLSQSISISDIAQASQVGIISLQEGFKRFKGMSPMAYLANLLLEAVHRDLIMANSAAAPARLKNDAERFQAKGGSTQWT
ncbi:hypothetical protein ACC870_38150, partial [Rhizobium ruizarguesonis]